MRGGIRLGGAAAGIALLPAPAYALDTGTILLPPALFLLAAVAVAAIVLQRLARRLTRVQSAYAEATAALRTTPAGYCLHHADGSESFSAGTARALEGIADVAGFAHALTPEGRDSFAAAWARLKAKGDGFGFQTRLAGNGASFDLIGRRLTSDEGGQLGDVVWLVESTARDRALAEGAALRQTLDALAMPVWRRGRDLALIDGNRAYAAAVDAPVGQAIAERREFTADEATLAGAAQRSGAAQTANRHIVIGGARRLMEVTEAPLPSGDVVGWARDVTDRETAEAELARHIGAHAAVLENAMVAIAIYGPDMRLSFFNTAFAQLWQLDPEWLAAEPRPSLDEVLEQLRERRRLPEFIDFRAFRQQQRALFTSVIEPQEELLHLPDERTLRLLVSSHPFGGLTFAYEDVTDKLALERSYNTLIEVQRATLDHLYEAVAVFGSDGRLKLSNPAYAQFWRLLPEDIEGEPHVAEIAEKIRPFFDDGVDWGERKRRVIARLTATVPASTRLERLDGSVLQAVTVPLPDGNVLLSYLDVTDSTRVEEALRVRNEALETADRLKSEFIANVSYELRTPLNAIIGFAEILANQYFGPLNPRQVEHSRGIIESSNQLLALINDILDLATVEAGYMQLETEEVALEPMLESVVTLTRERARNQGLTLELDVPSGIGTIVADERRLKQALFNLITNAIKFTPSGGTVILAARREGSRVELIVADTGIGVAPEDQERIFNKFERGNPQSREAGAGLGLALVKSLIELHGGHIELDSQPGRGTTVTCVLDLAAANERDIPPLRDAGD